MSEFANEVVELDLLPGRVFHELRERLLETQSVDARLELVEAVLLASLRCADACEPATRGLVNHIRAHAAAVRVRDLIERSGFGPKKLSDLFRREIGILPKSLIRVCRFSQALRTIAPVRRPNWARVAAECGYYDQAHLVHEFRQMSGLTPNEYVAARLPDVNHTVAD
jgi:AraC-like DNA-binding protein